MKTIIYTKFFKVTVSLMIVFVSSCKEKPIKHSSCYTCARQYELVKTTLPLTIPHVLNNLEDYVGRNVVIEAYYMRHMEGDWLSSELEWSTDTTLSIVGRDSCRYFTKAGEHIYDSNLIKDGTIVYVRGILHQGRYRIGKTKNSLIKENHVYLQVESVVVK